MYLHELPIKKCTQCNQDRNIPSHTTLCIDCYWNPKVKRPTTKINKGDS
mgnify:FL=1